MPPETETTECSVEPAHLRSRSLHYLLFKKYLRATGKSTIVTIQIDDDPVQPDHVVDPSNSPSAGGVRTPGTH
jgi:hypothetical protein